MTRAVHGRRGPHITTASMRVELSLDMLQDDNEQLQYATNICNGKAVTVGRAQNVFFFFSSRRRHTRWNCDWSSDVCSSDLSRRADALTQLVRTLTVSSRRARA